MGDTQKILSKVRERVASLSEVNQKSAADYVSSIREILKERTNYSVQRLNEMILEKVGEIESELITFDYVIAEAGSGIVDVFNKDINDVHDNMVPNIESGDVAEVLDTIITMVEKEMLEMLDDIDQMYTFYSHYLGDVLENKLINATDRISIRMNAERRYCDCTILDRIHMCYNISAQNDLITDQLMSTMRVVGALSNTRSSINLLESFFEDGNEHSRQVFDDSRLLLKKTEETDKEFLDSLVRDESNFLGTLITKKSFLDNVHIKRFVLRSFKTSIGSLPKYVNETLSDFLMVKEKHLNEMLVDVEKGLAKLGDAMKDKVMLINSAATRDEYLKKTNFDGLKLWMKDRFANVTWVVNPIFERRKESLLDMIKYTIEYIIEYQLSYANILSMANYLPTDICPLSTDYQKFVSLTLEEAAQDSGLSAIEDMLQTASYFTNQFTDDTEVVPYDGGMDIEVIYEGDIENITTGGDFEVVDGNNVSQVLPASMMDIMQGIINTFTDAGYELDGPVEIIIGDLDEK